MLNLNTDPVGYEDNIGQVTFNTDTFRRAPLMKKAQVNSVTFEVHDETGKIKKDALYEKAEGESRAKLVRPHALTVWPEAKTRPVKFMIGEGHLQSVDEIKRQLEESVKSEVYTIVEADCTTIGLETAAPGQSIVCNFEDDMRFSGLYYIRRLEHVWDPRSAETYITRFNLVRSFEVEPDGSPLFNRGTGNPSTGGSGGFVPSGVSGAVG